MARARAAAREPAEPEVPPLTYEQLTNLVYEEGNRVRRVSIAGLPMHLQPHSNVSHIQLQQTGTAMQNLRYIMEREIREQQERRPTLSPITFLDETIDPFFNQIVAAVQETSRRSKFG